MVGVFDTIAQALAGLIGTDQITAGFLLGLIVIAAFILGISFLLSDNGIDFGAFPLIIGAGVGITFAGLVGWWPIWTIIFLALFIVLVLVDPFEFSSGG